MKKPTSTLHDLVERTTKISVVLDQRSVRYLESIRRAITLAGPDGETCSVSSAVRAALRLYAERSTIGDAKSGK